MRDILREFPQIYLSREKNIDEFEFIEIVKSNYAKKADLIISNHRKKMIQLFQSFYLKLVKKSAKHFELSQNELILKITMRSSIINKAERVTGDSVTYIVDKVLNHKPKLQANEIFELLEDFKNYQTLDPDIVKKIKNDKKHHSLMPTLMELVRDYREGI
jgi:ABC-type long-subunit fatty acid transport system fused permease/ATPase subunit